MRDWPGARIGQDNVIWKPPGTKPLGFHQDDSYNDWIIPGEMLTCWITLDDTRADQGTIEHVRGSHKWPIAPPIEQFHAPDDPLADLQPAAQAAGVQDYEIVPVVVKAGTAVFHHGRTWHGSRDNRGEKPRRAVIAHCISSAATFHPTAISYIYSRYKKAARSSMDESYFPVLWRRTATARRGSMPISPMAALRQPDVPHPRRQDRASARAQAPALRLCLL